MAIPGGGAGLGSSEYIIRARVPSGDRIKIYEDIDGLKIQVVGLADEEGNLTGIEVNPLHVQGIVLDDILAAINSFLDAFLTTGLDKICEIRDQINLQATLTDTQPVSLASIPLPTGAATEATLLDLLAELGLKADLTETQPVAITNWAANGLLDKLCDILDELELKANLTEIQPVTVCASVLPDDAATETTLSLFLANYERENLVSKRYDETDPNCIYIGEALPGTSTASPTWRVRKITIVGLFTNIEHAGGGSFSEIWDDRTILVYS